MKALFAALLFCSSAFAQFATVAIETGWNKHARSEQRIYAGRSHELELTFDGPREIKVVIDSELPSVVAIASGYRAGCADNEPSTHAELFCSVAGDAVIRVTDVRGLKEFVRAGIRLQTGNVAPMIDTAKANATRIAVFRK